LSFVLRGMHPSALFGFDRLGFSKVFFLGLGLLFAALPLILASSTLISDFLRSNPQRDTQPIMQLFERASDPGKRVPLIILAVVIAPISEEFVFAGSFTECLRGLRVRCLPCFSLLSCSL